MKNGLFSSYWDGIKKDNGGETYENIFFKYFLPEYITALFLYSALSFLDSYFIGLLKSVSSFGALSSTNTLLHWFVKVGEAFSVSSIIMCGMSNGAKKYEEVGQTLKDTFWVIIVCAAIFCSALFFGAPWIFWFLGTPSKIAVKALPFLRVKALALFFMYIYFAFIGFLRGIKNTRTPMNIFTIGALVFIFFDYALIFGNFGFPALKLQGSAVATLLQYMTMNVIMAGVVFFNPEYKKYSISLFKHALNWANIRRFLELSWPVMLDKSSIAIAYIWINKMISPMGKIAVASFGAIKEVERFGFLPAMAFAQIITFLASNDYGAQRFERIKPNIKRSIFLASALVFVILFSCSLFPKTIIRMFDSKNAFTDFAAKVFPALSIFVFLDVVQIILSGALRGVGQIKTVMWTRLIIIFGLFMPSTYLVSNYLDVNWQMKFILIYVMFYIGSGIMGCIFINKFRSKDWTKAFKA